MDVSSVTLRSPARVLFVYWGRRGLSRFVLQVAQAAARDPLLRASVSVSRQNELFDEFGQLGEALVPVDTFTCNAGALLQPWRVRAARMRLAEHVKAQGVQAVLELMPHIWSPSILPAIRSLGARYAVLVHDAAAHPGDVRSASVMWRLRRAMRDADVVLTLTEHVATALRRSGAVAGEKVRSLFFPCIRLRAQASPQPPRAGEPWRLLFLGRVLPYKGLPLFLEMVEELSRRGFPVKAGVFGEGSLSGYAGRLARMEAEVVNRWLHDLEIDDALSRYHVVVASHVEASQSGVVALATGASVPVIATPVGGLAEQVRDGVTGTVAAEPTSSALADAATRLLSDPVRYRRIVARLASWSSERSIERFVRLSVLKVFNSV